MQYYRTDQTRPRGPHARLRGPHARLRGPRARFRGPRARPRKPRARLRKPRGRQATDLSRRRRSATGEIPRHGIGGDQGLEDHRRIGQSVPDRTPAQHRHRGKDCGRAGHGAMGRGENGFQCAPSGRRCGRRRSPDRRQNNGERRKISDQNRCYLNPASEVLR